MRKDFPAAVDAVAGFFIYRLLAFLHPSAVNPQSIVREIRRKTPVAPRYRVAKGSWIKPAWVVRRMVENDHWAVADAVREVIARLSLHPPDVAFGGIRAAYYAIRTRDWKEEPK